MVRTENSELETSSDMKAIAIGEWRDQDAIYKDWVVNAVSPLNTEGFKVHLRKGERILFHSFADGVDLHVIVNGNYVKFLESLPVRENWVVLEFSNRLLPSEFDVSFVVRSKIKHRWSIVVLKSSKIQ